jgi:hypothetical protein
LYRVGEKASKYVSWGWEDGVEQREENKVVRER